MKRARSASCTATMHPPRAGPAPLRLKVWHEHSGLSEGPPGALVPVEPELDLARSRPTRTCPLPASDAAPASSPILRPEPTAGLDVPRETRTAPRRAHSSRPPEQPTAPCHAASHPAASHPAASDPGVPPPAPRRRIAPHDVRSLCATPGLPRPVSPVHITPRHADSTAPGFPAAQHLTTGSQNTTCDRHAWCRVHSVWPPRRRLPLPARRSPLAARRSPLAATRIHPARSVDPRPGLGRRNERCVAELRLSTNFCHSSADRPLRQEPLRTPSPDTREVGPDRDRPLVGS